MLKSTLKGISFISLILLNGCTSTENEKRSNEEITSKVTQQSVAAYPWLAGEWEGKLYFHEEERSLNAKLKYHDGKLQIFFKEYCQGDARFTSKYGDDSVFIECSNGIISLTPVDSNDNYMNKIKSINSKTKFERVYIQYNENEKFAGFLRKEPMI